MPETSRLSADLLLASGFADRVSRWALARGASPEAAQTAAGAARQLSLACSAGDVCLELPAVALEPSDRSNLPRATDPSGLRELLLASRVVGTQLEPGNHPLVLDEGDRLYLHRYFDYERRLADRLLRLHARPLQIADSLPTMRTRLEALFAGARTGVDASPSEMPDDPLDWQRIAVAMALASRLTVVSGGPGTGKTTMVVNLLACLLQTEPELRVALAAPTGKAAARMTEAIRRQACHLPAQVASLLPKEASTIHRLLGVARTGTGFRHGAGMPLPVDLLIVDEASMLDLSLAVHLFEALTDGARVVLLGDKDQLAAVESGAVFADLSGNPAIGDSFRKTLASLCGISPELIQPPPTDALASSALADSVVWFTRNYRFGAKSGIGRLAACINRGDVDAVHEILRESADPGAQLRWLRDEVRADEALIDVAVAGYRPFIEALNQPAIDPSAVFKAYDQFRVLCALRDGTFGVGTVNERLSAKLRLQLQAPGFLDADVSRQSPPSQHAEFSSWYIGRPVMVLRNDYVLRLFNGDIGIALPDQHGELMVHFARSEGGFRLIPPVRLPPVETAFAMTVYKSQGSEFDSVLVVLGSAANRVMSRELLYTAVTRARNQVVVAASTEALNTSVQRKTVRRSGFRTRIAESLLAQESNPGSPGC